MGNPSYIQYPGVAGHTFLESPGVVVLSAAAMPGEVIASGFLFRLTKKNVGEKQHNSFFPRIPKTCVESRSDKISPWWSNTCAQGILKIKDGAFFNGQWLHLYAKSFPAENQVSKTIAESDCQTGQWCTHSLRLPSIAFVHSLESFGAIEIQPRNTSSHPETKLSLTPQKNIAYPG